MLQYLKAQIHRVLVAPHMAKNGSDSSVYTQSLIQSGACKTRRCRVSCECIPNQASQLELWLCEKSSLIDMTMQGLMIELDA